VRSPVERRRAIYVFGLLAIPIVLFGYLFVEQSRKDIAFAEKERLGVVALNAIMPAIRTIIVDDGRNWNQNAARTLQTGIPDSLSSRDAVERLLVSLEGGQDMAPVSLVAALDLIERVGDTSNLILDPDLDSYYIMDVALNRMPDLLKSLSSIRDTLPAVMPEQNATIEQRSNAALAIARFTTARLEIRNALSRAYASSPDGSLRKALGGPMIDFGSALQALEERATSTLLPPETVFSTAFNSQDEIRGHVRSLALRSFASWSRVNAELDTLLAARIAGFEKRLYITLLVAAFIALLALLLSIGMFRSMLHQLDDEIVFLAHHDPLTRLKNRAAITREIDRSIIDLKEGSAVAVHLIDLDRFKQINDTLGHSLGDEMIKEMGRRLHRIANGTHVVGRLGGDEFVLLQKAVGSQKEAIDLASSIVSAMRQPFEIGVHRLNVSSSVGSAMAPRHGMDQTALLVCADVALYAAKAAGRDRAHFFTPALEAENKARQEIENDLRIACAEDGFHVEFQAQYDVTGTVLIGFEALARMTRPDGSRVSPGLFIPVAEQVGLIAQIGEKILRKSCSIAALWPDHLTLSVNLSPIQFQDGALLDRIDEILAESGLPARQLTVEITEGLLLENSPVIQMQLDAIRSRGIGIAIDDFGSGYSSFAYLARFPFDKIKIDRSFITALADGNSAAREIIRTIILLGRSMNMTVIAEGVETQDQVAVMRELDCDEIQGYVYARPVPEIDLAGVILRDTGTRLAERNSTEQKIRKSA
jgi:diguanylate cyclase (GGDEF)-like protein